MSPVLTAAICRRPDAGSVEEKNSGDATSTWTAPKFPVTALALAQFVVTRTVTGPGGSTGTCTLIWVGKTPVIGALTPPKLTQLPARDVGIWPASISSPVNG